MARVILGTSTVLLLAGLALMAYFVLSGSTFGEDGLLVEEFWAWGLGIWLVIASLLGYGLWGAVKLITAWRHRRLDERSQ
jgi:hypothetical protein